MQHFHHIYFEDFKSKWPVSTVQYNIIALVRLGAEFGAEFTATSLMRVIPTLSEGTYYTVYHIII